jgi:hypothetical protein
VQGLEQIGSKPSCVIIGKMIGIFGMILAQVHEASSTMYIRFSASKICPGLVGAGLRFSVPSNCVT